MTRLTLMRHAKSSWDHPGLGDIQRPLNGRGQSDATLMGLVCSEKMPSPDLVLISPATRTRETMELFFEAWISSNPVMSIEEDLYLAGLRDWLAVLSEHADRADHIMACSHQPGTGEFARWLCPEFDGGMSTATVLSITFKSGELTKNSGHLDFEGRPKDFRY